jgi:serine/threonine-protein kinase
MGRVYKARDTRLDRLVAIKIALERFSERTEREARHIAALNHPNICTLHDVGPDYLVMEYIDGAPLQGPLPPERARAAALEIAAALEAAHARGIVHRDLKPGNILVTAAGIKLLDFGLAKASLHAAASESSATVTQTATGTVAGTAAYMSPEQAAGQPADARSDIFAFGAVLYEVLTGTRAFRGESFLTTIGAVLHQEPPAFGAPPDLERIVRRCLRKNPADRFQSAADLRHALENANVHDSLPSIAVLPFANMSGDNEQEYFSDGLTEEILNALAQIAGLKVIARTSSFAFKGQNRDVRVIAAELGVTNVLEGSVRRAGDRVRVNAQLIAAADGSHLWSQRYDQQIADVFAVQDEIAQAIATALQGRLAGERAKPRYTPKLPAYELYLKAMQHFGKFTRESAVRCKQCLDQTLALDPRFAPAHAMLGDCYLEHAVYSSMPAREALPLARSAARRAIELDPSLPEPHAVLARVAAFLDYDWDEAEREFRLTLAREPVTPAIRMLYAHTLLLGKGPRPEYAEQLESALQADPINRLSRFTLGLFHHVAGNFSEAARHFRQVLDLDPHFIPASYWLVRNLVAEGAISEALELAESLLTVAPENPEVVGGLAGLLKRVGQEDRAADLLRNLGDGSAYGAPIGFLSYHYLLGEPERSLQWMQRAIEQHQFLLFLYVRTPLAKPLLSAPGWAGLARTVHLTF